MHTISLECLPETQAPPVEPQAIKLMFPSQLQPQPGEHQPQPEVHQPQPEVHQPENDSINPVRVADDGTYVDNYYYHT